LVEASNAAQAWAEGGDSRRLGRWLDRALDPDGVPTTLPLPAWRPALATIADALARRPEGWPERFDAAIEGWFRALLRVSRPDGTTALSGPVANPSASGPLFRRWAERLSDPGLGTVVDWWFPGPLRRHAPPPLPADSRPDRVLAALRADWRRDGDFLVIDHRARANSTPFELTARGVPWLGPEWSHGDAAVDQPTPTRPRPVRWASQSAADYLEWSWRSGRARVVRSAVLLRGRRLAILAEQWDGPGDPGALRFGLGPEIRGERWETSDGVTLSAPRGRGSAQVVPISLPASSRIAGGGGSIEVDDRAIVLRQPAAERARRTWRAVVASWDPIRNRKTPIWRTLTVTVRSRVCPTDVAFGARISWGRDETLLIYRSLARPDLRSLLGHQTAARFLVGVFTAAGEVEPLLKVVDGA
jgi:hypothetical protein